MPDLFTNYATAIDTARANAPAALADSTRAYIDARRLIADGHDWAVMNEAVPAGSSTCAGIDAAEVCGALRDGAVTDYGRKLRAAIRVARAVGVTRD